MALAIVGFLLAGLIVTSGADSAEDDDEEEAEDAAGSSTSEPSTSTTRRRTSSTARRSTTTTLPPPIAPEPIGARLVVLRTGEVVLVDIDGNAVTRREVPTLDINGPWQGGIGRRALVLDGRLVFHAQDRAWTVPLTTGGAAQELAPALLMMAAADPRDVWLVVAADGRAAVQRWRADGSPIHPPVPLPVDWAPMAEVEGGLLLRRGEQWQVWDPLTDTTRRMSDPASRPVGGHGRIVAWIGPCDTPLCSVHLTDVVTGEDRAVLLGTTQIDWVEGTFSPDGRHLAIHAYRTPTPDRWEPGILLVDVPAGSARFIEASGPDGPSGELSWSPDSQWLFIVPQDGVPTTRIRAYSPARDATIQLQLPSRTGGYGIVAY